jgi:hypothetical protein
MNMMIRQPVPEFVVDFVVAADRHGIRPSALLEVARLTLNLVHVPGLLTDAPGVVWESYLGSCAAHAEVQRTTDGLQLVVTTDLEGVFARGDETTELARAFAEEFPLWIDDCSDVLDALREGAER